MFFWKCNFCISALRANHPLLGKLFFGARMLGCWVDKKKKYEPFFVPGRKAEQQFGLPRTLWKNAKQQIRNPNAQKDP